ncbi:MAG: GEVED domain-containing protein [Polaribacter sp.]|uniref:GEVED domain-containing protein n=1 Tax=Polaribacter sp. TaxID=1920175 RepID=UPI00326650E1
MYKKNFYILLLFYLTFNKVYSQSSYCTPIQTGSNNSFYISKVNIADIFNTSDNSANVFEYYNTIATDVIVGESYATSITYKAQNYNQNTLKVWIDFNGDGDFSDSNETVYSYTTREPFSEDGIIRNFQISIPSSATTGETRMRVAINRNNLNDACDGTWQEGEFEDYKIIIKPSPISPTANCVGAINLSLDILGNASITANDVNNNSFDDFDAPEDLILTLDKYNFDCSNTSSPNTITLTVTDTDGLSSTCTTTVNISPYSGSFVTPVIDEVTEYCFYSAAAPVMNFQCGQEIVATTTDTTTFNTAGIYYIDWVFNNGSTTETSTEKVTILTPSTPTNITVTNISETTAKINWDSPDTGTFNIRYRLNGSTDTWTETTATTTSKIITGLDDGFTYEVQIKTISSCGTYSNLTVFTTVEVQYCDNNVNLNKDNQYYISNVNVGNINNSSSSSASVYEYYNSISTELAIGETFSGDITYTRASHNTTFVVVWIDFNNNGDFTDAGEEILSVTNTNDSNSVFTIPLTNILVPSNATLGKTRLRVSIKKSAAPTSACNFDHQAGEIEDYDVFLTAVDDTSFESALISQVYNYNNVDNWIEITNTNSTETIPANKIALALYKDKSGDQSNVTPDATYLVNSIINPQESILIKKPSSTITNVTGLEIENSAITDFNDNNDILIITKKTDATAWENRFDVVTNINNNSSLVRSDQVTIYNSSYTNTEWIEFVDDNLSTTTNPPERHPHAPLISEVINANATSNVKLGIHKINNTVIANDVWSNGYPDRSRNVLINQDLSFSDKLSAKNLEVSSAFKLAIYNNLLVVTDSINLNTNSEIKLSGTSQLIQTHTRVTKSILGDGRLFVDQNSTVNSKYRYNYMSSPVSSSINSDSYTIADVLKDGTIPTTINSVAKNINFISGYDGNFLNSPTEAIKIADYWIYTYDFDGTASNYNHVYSSGAINSGKGYLIKGPGRAQNYTYTGTINDGNYSFNTTGNLSVLLGNPYASAINSKKFIEDNLDAITGTLYFWEHTGEESTQGNEGHYYSGYIGGYATRNLNVGLSANNVSSNSTALTYYNYNIEAENATLGGESSIEENAVLLEKINDSLTFKNINSNKSADTLRVSYKSLTNTNFEFYINGLLEKTQILPATGTTYDTILIPLQVNSSDILLLKLKENKTINIDKIIFRYLTTYSQPEQYIPIAQGFFISTDGDGGTITFNNSQREFITEGNNSIFLKTNKNKNQQYKKTDNNEPILKIEMNYVDSNNLNRTRKLGISFKSNNSLNFEKGYDSELFDLNETDFFWRIHSNDAKYVIVGVQEISDDLEVPIGIILNTQKELNFKIYQWNLPSKNVYLIDKLTNNYYLLNNNQIKLNLNSGEYLDRFYLGFNNGTLQTTNIINTNDVYIFYDKNLKEINIQTNKQPYVNKVKLYSILGKEINSWSIDDKNKDIKLKINTTSQSIYILKLTTNNGTVSKKILLN